MSTVAKRVVPAPVLVLRRRLDLWRRNRPKLGPIPDALWCDAVHLARAHGVNLVADALRLEYYALKRRLESLVPPVPPSGAAQTFIEVSMPAPAAPPEYLVEMERGDGGRMKVRLTDRDGIVALSESFWRCRP